MHSRSDRGARPSCLWWWCPPLSCFDTEQKTALQQYVQARRWCVRRPPPLKFLWESKRMSCLSAVWQAGSRCGSPTWIRIGAVRSPSFHCSQNQRLNRRRAGWVSRAGFGSACRSHHRSHRQGICFVW